MDCGTQIYVGKQGWEDPDKDPAEVRCRAAGISGDLSTTNQIWITPSRTGRGLFLYRNRREQRPIHGGKNTPKFGTLMVDQGKPGTKISEVFIMIEVEKDFASKGVAGAGLGLGIAGTALALMGNGGLGGLLGGCGTGWNNYGNGCGNEFVHDDYGKLGVR